MVFLSCRALYNAQNRRAGGSGSQNNLYIYNGSGKPRSQRYSGNRLNDRQYALYTARTVTAVI